MDSPPPMDSRPLPAWRTHINYPSVTSTPSSMGPEVAPTSVSICYTPELDALPALVQSPSTSLCATPVSPPPSFHNRRIHPIMTYSHSVTPPPIDPCLTAPTEPHFDFLPRSSSMSSARRSPARSESELTIDNDHEIAFLLRYFSESPGSWMDLFDSGTYFASYVPVKARENALLKYAAVACAAKALSRVQACKLVMGGNGQQTQTEIYPGSSLVDWKHKAAIYYDNAVSLLLQALKTDSTVTPDDSDCEFRPSQHSNSPKRRRTSSNTSMASSSDDLLAASAILCVYEVLDSSMSEWAKHLNGAKSLLVLTQDRMTPFQLPTPTSSISSGCFNYVSKARKATFWNIARQDMIAARKSKQNQSKGLMLTFSQSSTRHTPGWILKTSHYGRTLVY